MNKKTMKNMALFLLTGIVMAYTASALAFTYTAATKTARMTAVRDQMDLGAGAGKLEIGSAGMAVTCVTIALDDPSGTISSGILTLSGFPKTVAATANCTAAEARIRDSNNTDVVTGFTVGTSGTNIVLDNVTINNGQNVTINASPTITHAP